MRRVFDAVPTPCLILDRDFRIVAANAAYLAVTMTRLSDIEGRHLFTVFPDNPQDAGATGVAKLRASLERVLSTGRQDAMPVQRHDMRRPPEQRGSFEERYWSPINTPVCDAGGNIVYIVHRVVDVTDFTRVSDELGWAGAECEQLRARLEVLEIEMFERSAELHAANLELNDANERLRDSEQTLRLAQTIGLTAAFEWDIAADTVRWRPETAALYGFPEDSFSSDFDRWRASIHPDDRTAVGERIAKALETGHFEAEWRVVWPDGSIRWLAGRAVITSDGSPVPKRMLGINIDITERKSVETKLLEQSDNQRRIQAELASSKTRLEAVLDSLNEGVVLFDLDGQICDGNRAAREILGYAQACDDARCHLPACPATFDLLSLDGENLPIEQWPIQRVLRGESFTGYELTVRRKGDGKTVIISHNGSPVRSTGDEPILGVLTLADVTDRRHAEQALKDSERRLALALKASQSAVWEVDVATHKVLPADELLHTMLGYAPGEPDTLEGWLALIHDQDRPGIVRILEDVIRGVRDSYPGIELRYRARDDSWRWILCQAVAAQRDAEGTATRLVGTHTDIHERKVAEERAREAAQHDPLTGLPNRALVFEYGSHLVAAARRSHGRVAALFVDLDRFKPINDQYGHEIGDRVLQEVARRLVDCTRHEDLVGRLGGDEFAIVLAHPNAYGRRAAIVAQHVVDSIGRPLEIEGLDLSISPSIGISYFPEHGNDLEALIRRADLAMYQAKHSGRANYRIYAPEFERQDGETSRLEAMLREALERGTLMLHYQPVIDVRSGKMIGAEALVRLPGDAAETRGPELFIPIAESAGLIGRLGEWVAATACGQHAAWRREGLTVPVAINVSPIQFRQRSFADRLGRIISDSGIDPERLQLDVTESSVMENLDEAVEILNRIKSLGVTVALDDLGTGQSSLGGLGRLPIDKLKVDQSIVRGIGKDSSSRAVADAIIAIGHNLELDVIGKGIESEDSLRYLEQHGCDQVQGYWFSAPLPAPEFAQWTRARAGR